MTPVFIKRTAVVALSLAALVTAVFIFAGADISGEPDGGGEAAVFSMTEYFYEDTIEVEIEISDAETVYYTLDGSIPDTSSKLYTDAVKLEASDGAVKAYTLRASGYDSQGETVGTYTHTYFIGEGVDERFSSLVISISSDPEGLYGDSNGILVGGTLKENYLASHPDEAEASAPANYYLHGSESEREIWLEIIDSAGELLLSQSGGIRVHGGVTRSYDLKSLRILADDGETFDVDLFGDGGTTLFEKFVLRNSGNDYLHAFMRNEVALSLAADAGLSDTTRFSPAAVFINGEYYGFEWITEMYDDAYFNEKYGTTDTSGCWQIIEVDDGLLEAEDEDDLYEVMAVNEWNDIYTLCTTKDLTDDAVFYEFSSKVDVENFLLYNALEIYFANADWPNNNCRVYRRYSYSNEYGDGSTDGKWRFLAYDFDESLAKSDSSSASDKSLSKALGLVSDAGWNRYNAIFAAVMKRDDMKERFIEIMEELMEGALSPENICETVDEISEMQDETYEYLWSLAEAAGASDAEDLEVYQLYVDELEEQREKIKEFARERAAYILEELEVLKDY